MFFLLDQSESVGLDNFKSIMQFGMLFASSFTHGIDNVQMGAATFGTRVYPQFNIGALKSTYALWLALGGIPYTEG